MNLSAVRWGSDTLADARVVDPDLATDVCDTLIRSRDRTQPGLWARQQPKDHPAKRIGMTHVAMFDVNNSIERRYQRELVRLPAAATVFERRRCYDGRRHGAGRRIGCCLRSP